MKLEQFQILLNKINDGFIALKVLRSNASVGMFGDLIAMQRRLESDFDYLCCMWQKAKDEPTPVLNDLILEQ